MIIQIPFSGFYESIHSHAIDDAIDNQIFTDYKTGCENNHALSARLYDALNWRDVFTDYAREYAEQFAHKYSIEMEFESLSSPKEYNFTTDRIFCTISELEVLRIYDQTCKSTLDKVARDMFTSRDGFISFYDPDYTAWGDVLTWDYNQLHALIDAYVVNFDFHDDYEMYLMDDSFCNGFIDELLYKHCTDKRIYKVFAYLENRKAA